MDHYSSSFSYVPGVSCSHSIHVSPPLQHFHLNVMNCCPCPHYTLPLFDLLMVQCAEVINKELNALDKFYMALGDQFQILVRT